MSSDAEKVEAYFAALSDESRAMLEEMRQTIRAVVPGAAEVMSYGMPAFKDKKPIVAYAAFKQHCSLFPYGPSAIEAFKAELKGYKLSTGTIQFPLGEPLPKELIKRIVEFRVEQNAQRARR